MSRKLYVVRRFSVEMWARHIVYLAKSFLHRENRLSG